MKVVFKKLADDDCTESFTFRMDINNGVQMISFLTTFLKACGWLIDEDEEIVIRKKVDECD